MSEPYQKQRSGERRRFSRVNVPPIVRLRCDGRDFFGLIRTIGENGMFVDTLFAAPSGAELDVTIEDAPAIQVACVVRHCHPGWGVGVQFLDLTPEALAGIRKIMSFCGPRSASAV